MKSVVFTWLARKNALALHTSSHVRALTQRREFLIGPTILSSTTTLRLCELKETQKMFAAFNIEDYSHRRYSSILKPVNINSMWMLINICWDQAGGVIDVKKWWQWTLERDSDKQLCDSVLVLNQIQPSLINRANERASQFHGPPHQLGFLFHHFEYGGKCFLVLENVSSQLCFWRDIRILLKGLSRN